METRHKVTIHIKPVSKHEADLILAENLHTKMWKHSVACYRGQWFDIRGISKLDLIVEVKRHFGYAVNPDAIC